METKIVYVKGLSITIYDDEKCEVSTNVPKDIVVLHEYALANGYKAYRGLSKSGKYYYDNAGQVVALPEGEDWKYLDEPTEDGDKVFDETEKLHEEEAPAEKTEVQKPPSMKDKLLTLVAQYDDEMTVIKQTADKLSTENAELLRKFVALEREHTDTKEELKLVSEEYDKAVAVNAEMTKANAALTDQTAKQQTEINQLTARAVDAETKLKVLTEKYDEILGENQEYKAAFAAFKKFAQ